MFHRRLTLNKPAQVSDPQGGENFVELGVDGVVDQPIEAASHQDAGAQQQLNGASENMQ